MSKLSGGDCYEAAGAHLMDAHMFFKIEATSVTLVHGYPTLRRPPWKKYGHAWVEYYDPKKGVVVRDVANGHDVEMSKELYYSLGNINEAECRRYTMSDLRKWVLKTRHWGPWEPEPEGAL